MGSFECENTSTGHNALHIYLKIHYK